MSEKAQPLADFVDIEDALRAPPTRFHVMQLNAERTNSWAVIEHPSGAIALDAQNQPLMKMREPEAASLAYVMTRALGEKRSAAILPFRRPAANAK